MPSLRLGVVAFGLLLAPALAMEGVAVAGTVRSGQVSHVSEDAIEINGERILLGPESMIMSDGGEVSAASLRRGMFAEAEIDDAGRLISLQVNGVVE